jgi:hypothetical protein
LPSIFLPLRPASNSGFQQAIHDKKTDDRNIPKSRFPIFMSSMFLSIFPGCDSGVGGAWMLRLVETYRSIVSQRMP